jgi:hypothetical protein
MKFQAALVLILFVFACGSLNEMRKASIYANDKPTEQAELLGEQSPGTLPSTHEIHSSNASVHFEPLLLLLLGSTMFSIGTAIKLVLSRKLDPKHLGAQRKPPSPQR